MHKKQQQDQSQIKWISDFIWNIADDRLRDVYVRGKYRDVILPFTVLRRLDAVLETTKDAVLERKKLLDAHKVVEQDGALRMAAGQATTYRILLWPSSRPVPQASGCVMILLRIWMDFRPTSRKSSPSSVFTTRSRSWWIPTFWAT